jgi:hypothetical protein
MDDRASASPDEIAGREFPRTPRRAAAGKPCDVVPIGPYRLLGDLGRAEDMVQEAWLRWDGRQEAEEVHELNGQPALVFYEGHDDGAPFAALLLGVAEARIHRVFFHAAAARLRYLGPRRGVS